MISIPQAFADELKEVLQMMTMQAYETTLSEGAAPKLQDALWWEQPLSFAPEWPVLVGATQTSWLELGSRALVAAGVEPVDEESARSTYLEILQQTIAGLARRIAAATRKSVEAGSGQQLPAAPLLSSVTTVTLAGGDFEISIIFHAPALEPAPRDVEAAITGHTAAMPAPPLSGASNAPRNIDALLDVEMPVSISFGKAQLPLRDVLKLSAGSVVELNRTPEDSVEIVVNNCVIARGEVVSIDGNYGVRVQEIISRQQRLALHEDTKGLAR
jgi:flagellar motor switch protein FliN/FliY